MEKPLPHTVPKHQVIKRSLWQRWMAWSGSFFVVSLLLHIVLLGGATVLVVQVVQGRKEKLKFTAAPPTSSAPAEHKVKPSKKTAAAAPAVSKRITSTAVNAAVALPAMDLNASTSPDVMASVMSGMGASGLGSGVGGGAAGMAAMPVSGLTAFGFRGAVGGALVGHFYDLKQLPNHQPTEVQAVRPVNIEKHVKILEEFFQGQWDETVLQKYFVAKTVLSAPRIFMPAMRSVTATQAFGVDKETKGLNWVVLYKGNVVAPCDGTFRFLGYGDDMLAVRFNNEDVFANCFHQPIITPMFKRVFPSLASDSSKEKSGITAGKWFHVEQGRVYPLQVLCSEAYGGASAFLLLIEQSPPPQPYPNRKDNPLYLAYPVFETMKNLPPPEGGPEISTTPVIFSAK